jgi:hypothetical protein
MTRYNCSAELDQQQVATLADFLQARVLVKLGDGERLLTDGTVTGVPDDGTFYRDDLAANYSVRREMLVRIIDFLALGPAACSNPQVAAASMRPERRRNMYAQI